MLEYKPQWNRTSTSTGYEVVYCPDHPRAWTTGYIYSHIVLMEQKLGRLLEKGEIVHHKDENRRNNSIDNLELMTRHEHSKHHHAFGETMLDLVCAFCGKAFQRAKRQSASSKGYKNNFCSRKCNGSFRQRD